MKRVCIIGLGYIGLPTATLLASKNIKVNGIDINDQIVKSVNMGESHFYEPDLQDLMKKCVSSKLLIAYNKPVISDIYLIVVPTPFKHNNVPDISYIIDSINSIISILKSDDLIIIESTSPVGTTEKIKSLIYNQRPDLEEELFIAYCPERVLPGNIIFELQHNDRVIGGIDEKSADKAVEFYKIFVDSTLHKTDAKTAEMCKLVENSSRDVQIAFANELSMICEKAGINIWELISLANKHPRVNILNPGCGVGGHCIAVDPYFIVHDFPNESKLIKSARDINNFKPEWCVEKIEKKIIDFLKEKKTKPKLALLGLSFKPNVDDLRESPAKYIVSKLINNKNILDFYISEPNIKSFENIKLFDYKTSVESADIIVILVDHKEFKDIKIDNSKLLLDFSGTLSKNN